PVAGSWARPAASQHRRSCERAAAGAARRSARSAAGGGAPRDRAHPVISRRAWDAIVVGGGHNGLVAAALLGQAGLVTLLVEARERLGGAADTTELMPGVRVPTLAHTVGRLRPSVARTL